MRRIASRVGGGTVQADDLAQDAFLATLRGPGPRGDRRRWLAGILRNLARMDRRGRARRARREAAVARRAATPSAAQLVQGVELRDRVRAALEALPEPVRRAVRARYIDGATCASLARAEGVPASTIRNRVRRGLVLMRARLAREYDGDPRVLLIAFAPRRRGSRARAALAAGVIGLLGFAGTASAGARAEAPVAPPAPEVASESTSEPTFEPTADEPSPPPDGVIVP